MQLPMLPNGHDFAPHDLGHEPFPAVAVALADALPVATPSRGVMPFEMTVMEPPSCLSVIHEYLEQLSEPHVLPSPTPLPLHLSS